MERELVKEKIPRKIRECKRCKYQWFGRRGRVSKICPACKSPYWDTEKKMHFDKQAENRGGV